MKWFQKGNAFNKVVATTLAAGIALSVFPNASFAAVDDDDTEVEEENPRPGWFEAPFSIIELLEMKQAQQESFARVGATSMDDLIPSRNVIKPQFFNDFRNYKKKVKKYKEWSKYKRVSDNIVTGKSGGSIASTKEVTFETSVSGETRGLSFGLSASKTSSVGYTLNADPKTKSYMGYRVRYNVEEGENHYVDIIIGKTLSKKKYKRKVPMYGEYKLIKVD